MDKKPLCLVATTGTSNDGEEKVRHRYKLRDGTQVHSVYTLKQPDMHAQYRRFFNAVDNFNRLATGPLCVSSVWHTQNVWHRIFAATLGMIKVNGYLAIIQHGSATKREINRHDWRANLSHQLSNMGTVAAREESLRTATPL